MDEQLHSNNLTDSGTTSRDTAPQPQLERSQLSRRTLVRAGLFSLAGALLARQASAETAPQAQEPICNNVHLPLISNPGIPIFEQTLSLLPAASASAFYTDKLQKDAQFQRFARYFTERGLSFFADRVQLFMGIRPVDINGGSAPALPFLVAVAPAAQSFAAGAPSHEAASIVVLRERGVNSILAGSVIVTHKPYQIGGFQVLELDTKGELAVRRLERSQILQMEAPELAQALGAPDIDLKDWDGDIGALAPTDTSNLAALAYRTLLQASFDQGIYPPEALRSLVAESPLVQKLAVAHGIRYQSAVAGAGGACCSCSTTCSCHGCTTSSSSSRKVANFQTPTS